MMIRKYKCIKEHEFGQDKKLIELGSIWTSTDDDFVISGSQILDSPSFLSNGESTLYMPRGVMHNENFEEIESERFTHEDDISVLVEYFGHPRKYVESHFNELSTNYIALKEGEESTIVSKHLESEKKK